MLKWNKPKSSGDRADRLCHSARNWRGDGARERESVLFIDGYIFETKRVRDFRSSKFEFTPAPPQT
jgi:hypothetical protein